MNATVHRGALLALVFLFAITFPSGMYRAEENVRSMPYVARFGGSLYDTISDVATDRNGNLYITGTTRSADLPLKNALQNAIGGDEGTASAFVAKMSLTGELIFSTYFGGSNDDFGYYVDVDHSGAVYVTGSTRSDNLATTSHVVQPLAACPNQFRWCTDSFLLKLSPTGTLLLATYLGFGTSDVPRVAVTEAGIYLAGTARSQLDSRGKVSPGSGAGGYHAFVAKLKSDATGYEYVTHIEASAGSFVGALTVDAGRHVYVAGRGEGSCAFKTTAGAFNTPYGCLFVAKLDANDGSVDWLSRLGGNDPDDYSDVPPSYIADIAVDAEADVYVVGATRNPDYPTTRNAAQTTLHSIRPGGFSYEAHDGFVTKLTADGRALSYSTFLGGSSSDSPARLAVDAAGLVHVVGVTESEDLAGRSYTISRAPGELLCCWDAFAVTLSADGSAFENVGVFGGSFSDGAVALALSPQGAIWIGGYTFSPDLATTTGGMHPTRRDADGVIAAVAWRGARGSRTLPE